MATVNYLLRPNKNVERKLIIDCLKALRTEFDIDAYTYVGMGSMWFVDFIMAHKELGIRRMISIEGEPAFEGRAQFNKPYECVTVSPGESTKVLPGLGLEAQRALVWLDYNSDLRGPWREDLEIVCSKVPSGSVVIVTLNAHLGQLTGAKDKEDKPLSKEEAIRYFVGDIVPTPLPKDSLTNIGFAKLVGQLLMTFIDHATRMSGRAERLVPLFNFAYSDGAPMVTVGGMVAHEADAQRLGGCNLATRFEFAAAPGQYRIEVPALTYKEKLALDQLLPTGAVLDPTGQLGWTLSDVELRAYQRFYKHYPLFVESHF